MAEKKVIELEIKTESVGNLKSELRKAQAEVAALSEKFGATSQEAINAAKRAAELKDAIGDAKALTDAFNPDAKFNALSASIGGVLNGFQAFEGMVGLVGVESEALQETLLKVQSAMAVSQGIQGLMEARDNFKQLGAVASQALKGIRTGVAATGIGVLLVAVGTLVAYWDDIKELVSGVSEEQKKINAQAQARVEADKKIVESMQLQENSLKLQGKSEKQILQWKVAQYNTSIANSEAALEGIVAEQKARQDAAERNMYWAKLYIRFITEGIALSIRILAAPFDLMIAQANKVAEILGFQKVIAINFNEEISKVLDTVAGMGAKMIFDPEETKAEGQKTIDEARKNLAQLKSDRDGFLLQIRDIEKEDADKKAQAAKDAADKQKELDKQRLEDLKAQKEHEKEFAVTDEIEQAWYDMLVDSESKKDEFRKEQIAKEEEEQLALMQFKGDLYKQDVDNFFKTEEEKKKLREDNLKSSVAIAKSALDLIAEIAESNAGADESRQRKAFNMRKAANLASATIDGYKAVLSTYADTPGGPVIKGIAAAIAGAFAVLQISNIAKQDFKASSSGGGGSMGSSSSGGGTSAAITPNFNIVGNAQATNPLSGLGTQPIQAYVVSGEVTTAQSLDRNRINYATFG